MLFIFPRLFAFNVFSQWNLVYLFHKATLTHLKWFAVYDFVYPVKNLSVSATCLLAARKLTGGEEW
jgi:hypothetical protein